MGLISEYVEVSLYSGNIKYYENLGYKIPREKSKYGKIVVPRGTRIKVKVSDLPKGSNTKVKVCCDYCGKRYEMNYNDYNRYLHNGENYCKTCGKKILNSGENNGKWNSNKTDEEREIGRAYPKYTEFIKKVLIRDEYTCQCCGKESHGNIEVHHLDGYDWCVEKRTDETNGITLCKKCHSNFHSIYGKGNNTKEQFEEWFGNAIELLKYENELPTTRKIYCIEEDKIYENGVQLAKEWGCNSNSSIYNVCNHKEHYNSVKEKHLLWLDEYEKMTEDEIQRYLKKCKTNKSFKKVICITTRKVFNSLTEATRYYNCSITGINSCCKGRQKSAGKLLDGTKLIWKYIEELTEEEYIKYDIENKLKELDKL